MKIVYLDADEEITSIIDKVIETEEKDVSLVIPTGAQFLQSIINLRLLKREVDYIGKNVTIVTSDELGKQMAEKIDFAVKSSVEKEKSQIPVESVTELEEEDMIDVLVEEMDASQEELSAQLARGSAPKSNQDIKMSDIVKPKNILPKKKNWLLKKETSPQKLVSREEEAEVDILDELDFLEEESSSVQPVEKNQPQRRLLNPFRNKYLIITISVLVCLALGSIFYLARPKAEITISPLSQKIEFVLAVEGSNRISQIDAEKNRIPIQLMTTRKNFSKEFPATGEKQLNERATGTITVYNEYSSDPQTLVANTRFLSMEGKIFRTIETITIPGAKIDSGRILASSLEVSVVADEVGSNYNIGPAKFTIPGFENTAKYAAFYGESKLAMTGGSTDKVKVVTAQDLETAQEILVEESAGQLKQLLIEQMPSDLKLIEEALQEKIIKTSSPVSAGSQVDKFTLEITVEGQALFFSEEDLTELVNLNVAARANQGKILLPETQQIIWAPPQINWEDSTVNFNLAVQQDIAWEIDQLKIKKDLAGRKDTEIRDYLNKLTDVKEVRVTLWPFWVKKIPNNIDRVEIIIE